MWLRQSALLTWPLWSAAIGLIWLSDTTVCVFVCLFVLEVTDCEATGVNDLGGRKRRGRREIMWPKRASFFRPASSCWMPFTPLLSSFSCSCLSSLPLCRTLSPSQTISGLRKESVYSAAEACWNHAVFPLAKPTIATPWFAYFPCITRLKKRMEGDKEKKREKRESEKPLPPIVRGFSLSVCV